MGDHKAADREYSRRYRAVNGEAIRERARQRYAANPEPRKASARRYYEANPEAAEQRKRYYRAHREAHRQAQRRWRSANPEAVKATGRRIRAALRAAVFDHYGWSCACCGTSKRPTMDHVNGDGRAHREALFGGNRSYNTYSFYRWLIINDFPDGFQALCMPCNVSKKTGPRCQLNHQETA